MSQIIDLSHRLESSLTIYPGDPAFRSCPHLTLSKDGCSVTSLSIGSHAGTHIDAPSHFIADGTTVEEIPLSMLVGPAIVVDLTEQGRGRELRDKEAIEWKDLEKYETIMKETSGAILLLRTGWSKYWKEKKYFDHPYISADVARRIIATGVRVVGVDTLSPDETILEEDGNAEYPDDAFGFHRVVLGAGAVIAENLTNLDKIQNGDWTISLLPLKIELCDGSPVRACAWRRGER